MAKPQGTLYTPQMSRWALFAEKSNEMNVPSLSNFMFPDGIEVTEVTAVEIGRALDRVFAAGASNVPISFDINFSRLDPTRQYLRTAAVNHTNIQDSRFWLDDCDFYAIDLINDIAGSYQIGTMTPSGADKAAIITRTITLLINGTFLFFDRHLSGATLAVTANGGVGTPATITDSGNGFVDAGFTAGMTLYLDQVDGSDPFVVRAESVEAGVITLTEGSGDEGTVPAFTFTETLGKVHGSEPLLLDTTSNCNI